ncbi:MAG: hypothetical protein JSR90_13130 [Proteobacteria bacterium]|nr:hypothetical protein [Pseudomonadota bacterium]
MPVVIAQTDLDRLFHGLNLHQLALLTDAPALGSFAELQSSEGARVEQFLVDGKDTERCEALARDLLLGESALKTGDVREVRILGNGLDGHVLLRDHNDIVYRVTDKEAAIDQLLTNALQHQRQARLAERQPRAEASSRSVVVANGPAFIGTAGEILHGLAAIRARNGVAIQEIDRLMRTSGERNLAAALAAAGPERLAESLSRMALASQQIETLIEALHQRMRALLQLIEGAGAASPGPAGGPVGEGPAVAADGFEPGAGVAPGSMPASGPMPSRGF